jgi:hypothetical protein
MGPVYKNRGAVGLGGHREKGAGIDNSRKKKKGKKDKQDDKTVEPGQIYAGPDAEYGFKAYLKSFSFRRGIFVFSVFVPHIWHYREASVSCQREEFVLVLNK